MTVRRLCRWLATIGTGVFTGWLLLTAAAGSLSQTVQENAAIAAALLALGFLIKVLVPLLKSGDKGDGEVVYRVRKNEDLLSAMAADLKQQTQLLTTLTGGLTDFLNEQRDRWEEDRQYRSEARHAMDIIGQLGRKGTA